MILIEEIKNVIREILTNELAGTELDTNGKIDYCQNILTNVFDKKVIYREFIKQYIHYVYQNDSSICNPYIMDWTCTEDYIQKLQLIEQPEQRTPEWFAFRSERLTASDIATALNENTYCRPKELILKKCGIKKPFSMNAACQHGVKYEPVSCMLYEYYEKKKVYEFGCISHKYYNFLGASPDGICSDGTMLEIKNPLSRTIYGIPPKYYWIQMQIQMEVFDLHQCDYLECKMTEYFDYEEYEADISVPVERKGVLVEYITSDNYQEPKYEYCPIAHEKPLDWVAEQQKKFDALPNTMYDMRVKWWKVDTYSCERIYRDTEWFSKVLPELATFWDDIIRHRKTGSYKNLITTVKKRKKVCKLLDDDIDDKNFMNTVEIGNVVARGVGVGAGVGNVEHPQYSKKNANVSFFNSFGKCLI